MSEEFKWLKKCVWERQIGAHTIPTQPRAKLVHMCAPDEAEKRMEKQCSAAASGPKVKGGETSVALCVISLPAARTKTFWSLSPWKRKLLPHTNMYSEKNKCGCRTLLLPSLSYPAEPILRDECALLQELSKNSHKF